MRRKVIFLFQEFKSIIYTLTPLVSKKKYCNNNPLKNNENKYQ